MSSPVDLGDLREIDLCVAQAIDMLRNLDAHGVSAEVFTDYFNDTFVTRDSSGATAELCDGGSNRPVTYGNHLEFADSMERFRLQECAVQLAAMRRGIGSVVPAGILSLFTHRELELHIAGCPRLDIGLLRSCTTYSGGASGEEPHLKVRCLTALSHCVVSLRCLTVLSHSTCLLYALACADSMLFRHYGRHLKVTQRNRGACSCDSCGEDLDCLSQQLNSKGILKSRQWFEISQTRLYR